jgi:hypothetical protein
MFSGHYLSVKLTIVVNSTTVLLTMLWPCFIVLKTISFAQGCSSSSWGPTKLMPLCNYFFYFKYYNTFKTDFPTCYVCVLMPLLYYHISTTPNPCVRVCMYCIFNRVCIHMSVPMFVLLHSPHCSIRCIFIFFTYNFTACMIYLIWNRVWCCYSTM